MPVDSPVEVSGGTKVSLEEPDVVLKVVIEPVSEPELAPGVENE